ncbi:MAG: hypothetical protein SFY32_08090 [Bacteroidota bacterium]|nr:hypothetical protein [Bacteroidota bacterium]
MKCFERTAKLGLVSILVLFTSYVYGQSKSVGIGTNTPNPRAVLDINVSDPNTFTQGLLLPRLNNLQRANFALALTPADAGMSVYDITDKTFYTWDGTQWKSGGTFATITGIGGITVSFSGNAFTIDGGNIASQWINTTSGIYFDAGFVGIGNVIPNEKLTVQGNISSTGTVFGQSLQIYQATNQASFFGTDATGSAQNYLEFSSGRYNSNNNRLDARWQVGLNQQAASSPMDFWGIGRNNIGYDFIVTRDGNVGVGLNISSVNEKLVVTGNSSVTGIGYFGSLTANNLIGAPTGSVLTTDGIGNIGYGSLSSSDYWTLVGSNLTPTGNYNLQLPSNAFKYMIGTATGLRLDNYYSVFVNDENPTPGTGFGNAVFGYKAGNSLSTGAYNNLIGYQAGRSITIGSYNNFIGNSAGEFTTGSGNQFIGAGAGFSNITGSYNILIGDGADVVNSGQQYSVAIGANATVGGNNMMALGGTGSYAVNVGIGTGLPTAALHVVGGARIENLSISGSILTVDGSGNLGMGSIPSSQWTTNASDIYYNTGNVGIGSSNTNSKLHIKQSSQVNELLTDVGSGYYGAGVTFENNGTIDKFYMGYGFGGIFRIGKGTAANVFVPVMTLDENSVVVPGTFTSNNLKISSLSNGILSVDGLGNVVTTSISNGNQWISASSNQIYTNSFVGIGTNNPTRILDIRGTGIRIQRVTDAPGDNAEFEFADAIDSDANRWRFGLRPSDQNNNFNIANWVGGAYNIRLFMDPSSGNVGIGNPNGPSSTPPVPSERLVVYGNAQITGTTNTQNLNINSLSNGILSVDGLGNVVTTSISNGNQWISASSNQIYTNSFVGIGTNSPSSPLTIFTNNNNGISINSVDNGFANATIFFNSTNTGSSQISTGTISMKNSPGDRVLQFFNATQGIPSNEYIYKFLDNSTVPIVSILNNGNFGIGNFISPNEKLTVFGNSSVSGTGYFGTLVANDLSGAAGSVVTVDGLGKLGIGSFPAVNNQWISASSNQIYTNSFVGIGVSNPNQPLAVGGGYGTVKTSALFTDGSNSKVRISHPNPGIAVIGAINNQHLIFGGIANDDSSFNPYMTIQSNGSTGNVGIGTTLPGERLVVDGNSSTSGIGYFGTIIGNDLTGASGSIVTVDGAGKLGIGTLNIPTSQWITTSSGNIFTSSARIGVGGINPQFEIHVYNPTQGAYQRFETPSTGGTFSAVEFKTGIYNTDAAPTDLNAIWQWGMVQSGGVSNPTDRYFIGRAGLRTSDFGVYRDGNIGVNMITLPNERFVVNGNSSVNGIGYFGTIVGNNLSGAAGSVVTVDGAGKLGLGTFGTNNWVNSGANSTHTTGGNVGINIANPINARLEVGGNNPSTSPSGAQEVARFGSNDNNALRLGIWIQTDPVANNQYMALNAISAGNRNLLLQSTGGNVSIGTALPNEKLLVQGNTSVTGIGYLGSIIGNNLTGAAGSIVTVDGAGMLGLGTMPNVVSSQWITTTNGIYYSTSVGVGMLPIAGNTLNIKSTGNSTKPIRVEYSGTTFPIFEVDQGSGGQGNLMLYDNAGAKIFQLGVATPSYFNGNSNFGIGLTTPNEKLTVQGNTSVTGILKGETLIGGNMSGAPVGSIVTVDGVGKLGYGTMPSGIGGSGTNKGIAYFTNSNTLTSDGTNFTWDGTTLGINGSSLIIHGDVTNNFYAGSLAGNNSGTGTDNVFFGFRAGNANANGASNNFFGKFAGQSNTSGLSNNFFGLNAGQANTSGAQNNFFGQNSGFSNNTGSFNNFFGIASGNSNTSGYGNIFIGSFSGVNNSTGFNNLALGTRTQFSNNNLSYAVAIGAYATVGGSNMMALGAEKGSGYEVKVGIGTSTPNQELVVVGNTSVVGVGHFGTLVGNNMFGAPTGSVVTVDGLGTLGYGTLNITSSQWINSLTGIYYGSTVGIGIAPTSNFPLSIKSIANSSTVLGIMGATSTGLLFHVDEEGGNSVIRMHNSVGTVRTQLSSGGISYMLDNVGIGVINAPNSGNKLMVQGNTSISGAAYLASIVGNDLAGAAGSIITVDGVGKLGLGLFPAASTQWLSASTNQIYTTSMVGIGNANPSSILHVLDVKSGSNMRGVIFDISQSATFSTNYGYLFNYSISGAGGTQQFNGLVTSVTGNANNSSSSTPAFLGINNLTGNGNAIGFDALLSGTNAGAKTGIRAVVNGTGGTQNIGINVNVSGGSVNYAGLFNGGNVGIGTVTPTATLDVVGNAKFAGPITVTGLSGGIANLGVNANGEIVTVAGATPSQWTSTIVGSNGIFYNSGNVSIGVPSVTGAKLKVGGDLSAGGMVLAAQSFVNPQSTYSTTDVQYFTLPIYIPAGTTSLEGVFTGSTSNVATTATYTFDIDGGAVVQTSTTNSAAIAISSTANINVTSLAAGWHMLSIKMRSQNSADAVYMYGFSLVVKN